MLSFNFSKHPPGFSAKDGDENVCPWESTPADDTSLNVSSSGRHAKESPEVGTKANSGVVGAGASSANKGIVRRGSDPTLLATASKTTTPTKITGNSTGGSKPISDTSKSLAVNSKREEPVSDSSTSMKSAHVEKLPSPKVLNKKPSCRKSHHRHHHHPHVPDPSSITSQAVLDPSNVDNSLISRHKVHHTKHEASFSPVSAISATTTAVSGALVDPSALTGVPSGKDVEKDYLQKRELGTPCSSFSCPANSGASSGTSSTHHHHHHHHHHSSGASRRTKNRSKRKKTSKGETSTSGSNVGSNVEASKAAPDVGKHIENKTAVKHHPKPHHQHSTSSLLGSSVRVASGATLLGSVAPSLDSGSSPGGTTSQGRKGSSSGGGISSAVSSVAMGMVPTHLAQPRCGKEPKISIADNPEISISTQVSSNIQGLQSKPRSPGHSHHSHHHSRESFTVTNSGDTVSSTGAINFPGTSSKCTQTKLDDEDDSLIPTSPTLARQSPMLSGGTGATEGSVSNTVSLGQSRQHTGNANLKSNTAIEETLEPGRSRCSRHSHRSRSRQEGSSSPSQSYTISKSEQTPSLPNVPVQSVSHQSAPKPCVKTDDTSTKTSDQAIENTNEDGNHTHKILESKYQGPIQPSLEATSSRAKNTDLDDRGPGPPIEKHAGGNHGNQAEVNEPLQEEVACSASKSGDKNTADITQQNEVQGATGSSATQTEWSSSTEVCPWEDE